jgi:kynurenine formamidase
MAILECLSLKSMKAYLYSIVALPLKILDGDASPVRAIMLKYDVLPKLKLENHAILK